MRSTAQAKPLSPAEERALRLELTELSNAEHRMIVAENRRLASIKRAMVHPMPANRRQQRAGERAFAYPAR